MTDYEEPFHEATYLEGAKLIRPSTTGTYVAVGALGALAGAAGWPSPSRIRKPRVRRSST